MKLVVSIVIAVFGLTLVMGMAVQGDILWYDDFDDEELNADYVFKDHPGEWIEEDGVVKQVNPAPGDHTYLIIEGGFPEPHTVLVKIRVDVWENHDLSRTGVGLRLQADGAGYAFLIHENLSNMEFLNDHLAWANNDTVPPFGEVEVGSWYWMKAEISDDGFNGKIWPEEENEPADWLLESALNFGGARAESGNVGLNGGSNAGAGVTNVSFDSFLICDTADECTPQAVETLQPVEPGGKLSSTWAAIKK